MQHAIRRLIPSGAELRAILAIEAACFGESVLSPSEALRTLTRPEHWLYAAQGSDGRLVGFCSCFELGGPSGPRLEIDLLAVLPDSRGQGISTAMVAAAKREANARGVTRLRAAVRMGNEPSERAFLRAGLVPSVTCYQLLVYAPGGRHAVRYLPAGWRDSIIRRKVLESSDRGMQTPPQAATIHGYKLADDRGRIRARAWLVLVYTLSGAGLWIERLDASSPSAAAIAARGLVERAKRWDIDQVGMLVPERTSGLDIETILGAEGFQRYGRFRLFRDNNRPSSAGLDNTAAT